MQSYASGHASLPVLHGRAESIAELHWVSLEHVCHNNIQNSFRATRMAEAIEQYSKPNAVIRHEASSSTGMDACVASRCSLAANGMKSAGSVQAGTILRRQQ